MKDKKEITVNWNVLKSIEKGESEIDYYKSKGYKLFSQSHGINTSTYIYIKK